MKTVCRVSAEILSAGIESGRFGRTRQSVTAQAIRQLTLEAREQTRSLEGEGAVELDQGRPRTELAVGILAAGDAADAKQWHLALGKNIEGFQYGGRELEEGAAAQATGLGPQGTAQAVRALDGGVGDDDSLEGALQCDPRDIFKIRLRQVGSDLEQERWRRLPQGVAKGRQKLLQLLPSLQRPQTRCIGRRDVDDEVVRMGGQAARPQDVIGHGVGAVLVLPQVDADQAGGAAPGLPGAVAGKTSGRRLHALAVEAVTVDHGVVLLQAKYPRARIAGLGTRRDRAYLHEAESQRQQSGHGFRMLVQAGGPPRGIGETPPPEPGREPRVVCLQAAAAEADGQRPDRQAVCRLWIEAPQQRTSKLAQPHGSLLERREKVTIGRQGQWLHPDDRRRRQPAIEVREQLAAARWLPLQGIPQGVGLDRQNDQAILTGAVFGNAFADLGCGRKMDEAIAQVVAGTAIAAVSIRLRPGGGCTYVIDELTHGAQVNERAAGAPA